MNISTVCTVTLLCCVISSYFVVISYEWISYLIEDRLLGFFPKKCFHLAYWIGIAYYKWTWWPKGSLIWWGSLNKKLMNCPSDRLFHRTCYLIVESIPGLFKNLPQCCYNVLCLILIWFRNVTWYWWSFLLWSQSTCCTEVKPAMFVEKSLKFICKF